MAGPVDDVNRFSSPYPDTPPLHPPPQNLFHDARFIDDTWLDEQGNEFRLPSTVMDDQNWVSQRAQDFQHDIDAGRSHKTHMDDLWGSLSDDDDSSSGSDEPDDAEFKMPGLAASGLESDEYAPYGSKTVSNCRLKSTADSHHGADVYPGSS